MQLFGGSCHILLPRDSKEITKYADLHFDLPGDIPILNIMIFIITISKKKVNVLNYKRIREMEL